MDKQVKFTVQDIVSKNEKKTTNRNITKNMFLERCKKRIEAYNKFGKENIIFEITDFVIGIPPYNPEEITKYLFDYLMEAGFYVYKIPKVNALYISWKQTDIEKINNQKNGYLTLSLNDTGLFDNLPINPNAIKKSR